MNQKQMIMGDVEHGFADADTNRPVKIGGRARQTNPTAVFNTERVEAMFDDLGRQVMTLHQVRDLIATASASLTNGTPTSLLDGTTGEFHDLIWISFTNSSNASVTVALTDDSLTVKSFEVPVSTVNSGIVQAEYPIPWPQGATGSAWRVDMPDITGTTVTVEALFAKNA